MTKLLNCRQTCIALSISRTNLYRLTKAGEIRKVQISANRVGWPEDEIQRFVQTRCSKLSWSGELAKRNKLPTKPGKRSNGQFLKLPYEWIRHKAWQNLSSDAWRVLIEMHLGFNGHNTGEISFSVRQAADCLHSGKGRASRALNELEEKRFIACTGGSSFNVKQRMARTWRLTMQPNPNGHIPHDWKNIRFQTRPIRYPIRNCQTKIVDQTALTVPIWVL